MGSSTRAAWIPDVPQNDSEVMDTMRAYQQALSQMDRDQLMGELTRINGAIQQQGQTALAAALTQRLEETIGSLDRVTLRSPRMESQSPGSARGQAAQASQPSPQQPQWLPRSQSGGLGRAAAARIAAADARRRLARNG